MPSGKRARQRREGAENTPPPAHSASWGGGRVSRRTLALAIVALVVVVGLGIGIPLGFGGGGSGGGGGDSSGSTTGLASHLAPLSRLGQLESPGPLGPAGPEGPPVESGANLAPAGSPPLGGSVDGIKCQGGEQTLFHIHARLTVFVNGHSQRVPYGVGISHPLPEQSPAGIWVGQGSCFSWLHTHAADGVIHIESPVQRTFTLGNFFDVWGQPLSATSAGSAHGHVTVLFDGKVWTGDPRAVPLQAHAQIQLEVGRPLVAPVRITNWFGL